MIQNTWTWTEDKHSSKHKMNGIRFKEMKDQTILTCHLSLVLASNIKQPHNNNLNEIEVYFSPSVLCHCCCLVTKSCPTLCNPVDCSTPGFPVLPWSLFRLKSVELVMSSNHLILCNSLLTLGSKKFGAAMVSPQIWGAQILNTTKKQKIQAKK